MCSNDNFDSKDDNLIFKVVIRKSLCFKGLGEKMTGMTRMTTILEVMIYRNR